MITNDSQQPKPTDGSALCRMACHNPLVRGIVTGRMCFSTYTVFRSRQSGRPATCRTSGFHSSWFELPARHLPSRINTIRLSTHIDGAINCRRFNPTNGFSSNYRGIDGHIQRRSNTESGGCNDQSRFHHRHSTTRKHHAIISSDAVRTAPPRPPKWANHIPTSCSGRVYSGDAGRCFSRR